MSCLSVFIDAQLIFNRWYLFDFFVVVVSILGIALEEIIGTSINPSVVRGIRMLRVVRGNHLR